MTDRELLEDAAKAAGYVLVWGDKYKLGDDEIDCTDIPYIRSGQPDEGDVYWNPLTDDGDALRLLVRLGSAKVAAMEIGPGGTCLSFFHPEADADEMQEPGKPFDPLAATRRAIVRAAAEIGKGMK